MPAPKRPSLPTEAQLIVDFANTVGCPACRAGDALDSYRAFRGWARRRARGVRDVPARELGRLRALREELVPLLGAAARRRAPPPRALDRLNARLAAEERPEAVEWRAGTYRLREVPTPTSAAQALSDRLVRAAVSLLTGPEAPRLKECEGTGCAHLLLARTRTQRWCSPTGCGNRARVARHYRKQRS